MSHYLSPDHKVIANQVSKKSKVLDLGCGNGELLSFLIKEKNVVGYGIEIAYEGILNCVEKGLSVYQSDLNEGLNEFAKNSFDTVILSQTLQQVKDPLFVLNEMLRVGKIGIISFPNFGFWKIRLSLLRGLTPVTNNLPYQWYNTPNIRVITNEDFRKLCKENNFKILKEIPVIKNPVKRFLATLLSKDLFATKSVFIISKS